MGGTVPSPACTSAVAASTALYAELDFGAVASMMAALASVSLASGIPSSFADSTHARVTAAAGADGIMIHSRQKQPDEILEFCDKFREKDKKTPIVVVPTSYGSVTEEELSAHGVNIVIYANQLTRSAFPAMQNTAMEILKHHRAKEADEHLMPFKDIIRLIDEL